MASIELINKQMQLQQGDSPYKLFNSWKIGIQNAIFWRQMKMNHPTTSESHKRDLNRQIIYLTKKLDLVIAFKLG